MGLSRRRIAQVGAAVAAAAMLLPWHTDASDAASETVQGISTNDGQLVLVVGLVTVGLIQVGWRPAWIGAGFMAAVTVRRILDSDTDPAVGLWTATAVSVVAAALLIWDLFANVSGDGESPAGGATNGRGLSGPLGRRRR